MKVSLAWLREFIALPESITAREVADRLTFAGLEVEDVFSPAERFAKIYVGEILEIRPHPNADRLQVTKVSVGDALGAGSPPLTIVCGARNIAVGQKVPVATIGAVVPAGFEIKASKIRGEPSQGMLCSADELKIPADPGVDGIKILAASLALGLPIAQALGFNDDILEIKVTPNRGDALSHRGLARDLAAILNAKVHYPRLAEATETNYSKLCRKEAQPQLAVTIAAKNVAAQYHAILIDGIKVGPSPAWLVQRLDSLGLRSVNNVVDATTLVMMELGQPVHAFDADILAQTEKSGAIHLGVRLARSGEKLETISHRLLDLTPEDLVITAGAEGGQPVALAGVMGGKGSEVSESTKRVVIESAEFSADCVRKMKKRHQLLTDAAYRFERGVDPAAVPLAAKRTAELVATLASVNGQTVVHEVVTCAGDSAPMRPMVNFARADVLRFLGAAPSSERIEQILRALGIEVENGQQSESWKLRAPSWRHDLERAEDYVEEVGRIWGFENIEPILPLGGVPFVNAIDARERELEKLRRHLVSLGFFESVSYAFTNVEQESLGLSEVPELVAMEGALERQFQALKASLLPGLIRAAAFNHARQKEAVRFFEIRSCFAQKPGVERSRLETGIREQERIGFALSGPAWDQDWQTREQGADFFTLKGILESVFQLAGKSGIRFSPLQETKLFHPGQAAIIEQGKLQLGRIGCLHPALAGKLGIKRPLFLAELDLQRIVGGEGRTPRFKEFGKFPEVERDFSVTIPAHVSAASIQELIEGLAKPLLRGISFFDLYRGERVPEGKISLAFRCSFGASDHTLTESEIAQVHQKILDGLVSKLGAQISGL